MTEEGAVGGPVRRSMAVGLSLVLGLAGMPGAAGGSDRGGRWARVACRLPDAQIQRVHDGYHPERSGEIQFVPREPNFIGNFASHSGPWGYLQEVPLLLYGPGHVPAVGAVRRPVTSADLAPTFAEYLDFGFQALDGSPLTEALGASPAPPRLIVTVVWDGGGRNVLRRHRGSWPTLRRLRQEGAWFERATVGSSPSNTPSIHSTIGTGAFPRHHGIVDLRFRMGNGPPTARRRAAALIGPTLADAYDPAMGNEPVIGMVGAEGTLGMIGHGALWAGGDADIAAAQRAGRWRLSGANADAYGFPSYVPDLPGYRRIRRRADRQDGRRDGRWFTLPLSSAEALSTTPAYSDYQVGVIGELIRREGFGADATPDLLYVNFKQIDKVGHRFSFHSRQMAAVVRGSDRALRELVGILDRDVGPGQWVLAVTADHGSTPKPSTTGAVVIDNVELARDLQRTFDGAIQSPRVTQAWVNERRLRRHGHSLGDVARYLLRYTRADNTERSGRRGRRLFSAAFPGTALENARCVDR